MMVFCKKNIFDQIHQIQGSNTNTKTNTGLLKKIKYKYKYGRFKYKYAITNTYLTPSLPVYIICEYHALAKLSQSLIVIYQCCQVAKQKCVSNFKQQHITPVTLGLGLHISICLLCILLAMWQPMCKSFVESIGNLNNKKIK